MASKPLNLSQKLIQNHLVSGEMAPGETIAITVDQTLTQDATGTLVMLELEAMGLDEVKTQVSAQYVDHNLIQADFRNADDHLFLQSACQRFGVWFSRPGNGISHPLHQQCFAIPGQSLLGSDSHTCAAGSMGMLAMGAGGLDVALAMAGEPFRLSMPRVIGVELTGKLSPWVSAKDVILELLRRRGVSGAVGSTIEYYGDGLENLEAMDRHVIANMGAELGATATVFPSDDATRRYLKSQGRQDAFVALQADSGAAYDEHECISLDDVEPLIAMPSSPGNVVPVGEVAGEKIHQSYIGSSANPGYRDYAVAADIVRGKSVHESVSFDINPSTRQTLDSMMQHGVLASLLRAGARIHQAGCNGCIGMGQAPATNTISLRTVPRNFPGRSGTQEDKVCLVSPETAAASALSGVITDPRTLTQVPPVISVPAPVSSSRAALMRPRAKSSQKRPQSNELRKGPNIQSLPELGVPPAELELPVLLKMGDDISTDEILPAGAQVLPYRSNIEEISRFAFQGVSDDYDKRARECKNGHAVVARHNYGQGSSREHAAIAPRFLGLRAVLACSFSRIHRSNLINFGVLPLIVDEDQYDHIADRAVIKIEGIDEALKGKETVNAYVGEREKPDALHHNLSDHEREVLGKGGVMNMMRESLSQAS